MLVSRNIKYLLKKLTRLHYVLTDKRIQSIYSIETYAYGTSKDLVCKKEEIKCNNIIKQDENDITKKTYKKLI